MHRGYLATVVLVGVLSCTPRQIVAVCDGPQRMYGNELFDAIADAMRESDMLRVLPLKDIRFGFEKKVGLIHLRGEAKLHDGTVTGLDTAHRLGDATVILKDNNRSMEVRCTLGMGAIDFDYQGTVTFMGHGPSVKMHCHTGYVTVDAVVHRDAAGTVRVELFKIRDFEALHIQFSGLGPITWMSNLLTAPAVTVLQPVFKRVVEKRVKGVIERALPDILSSVNI